jgi:hypothetical protein
MRILVCAVAIALAVGVPAPARAQSGSAGVKGGINVGKVTASGTDAFDTKVGTGGSIGGFVAIPLGETARIQPEVLFSQRRFSGVTADLTVESRAVEVPILLHLLVATGQRVRPVLFAGPQLTFISKVTQSTAQGDTDISDNIAGVDAGLTFGGGFEMAAGRGAFVVDGRVNIGMKDLSQSGPPALKSRAFLLLAGYRF